MTPRQAVGRAIKVAGGQAKLARILGVSPSAVANWLKRDGRIGAEHALNCHYRLSGAIHASKLRPDLYPERLVDIKDYSAQEQE